MKSQPSSTCGQCGKIFGRSDNLAKHLRHCTGHRPPQLPQQQQQHASTQPPPELSVHHQYTSTGGAVEHYSINMQEAQNLDHLSTALHLILPMTQFHTEHHAYKFQIAITIVCHKAVDPRVVRQPPVTLTSEMIAVYAADTAPPIDDVNRRVLNFIEVFELNGSGWAFSNFQSLQLTWQLDLLRVSAFTPLPRWFQARRVVVNVAGTGDDCFKWAILAGMHPVDVNTYSRRKYVEHMVSMIFLLGLFPSLSRP